MSISSGILYIYKYKLVVFKEGRNDKIDPVIFSVIAISGFMYSSKLESDIDLEKKKKKYNQSVMDKNDIFFYLYP